jgi:hypothetical protein
MEKKSITDVPTSELLKLIKESVREIRRRNELIIVELREAVEIAREEIRRRNTLTGSYGKRLLTEKRYKLILCFLENPFFLNRSLKDMSKRAGVSVGLVKRTLNLLEGMGYLKGRKLIKFDELEKLCSEYENYRL